MGESTGIQWTDATVNFWWGCTKVGPGCDNCYAEKWNNFRGNGQWGLDVERSKIKSAVALIRRLNRMSSFDRWVFIQSMSDLFDLEVDLEWFREAWGEIVAASNLKIQIVTKRISVVEKRLTEIGVTSWPGHAGLIISVVNQAEANRDVPRLIALKKKLSIPWIGISAEPLLGPLDLTPWLADLDWVIAGGESGPNARPMHPDWARSLRDQCARAGVPFFFKQWGEYRPSGPAPDAAKMFGIFPSGEHHRAGELMCGEARVSKQSQTQQWSRISLVGKKAAGNHLDGRQHLDFPR